MKGQRIPDRRSSNPQCSRSNDSFYMRFSEELLSLSERNAREGMYGIIKEARYDCVAAVESQRNHIPCSLSLFLWSLRGSLGTYVDTKIVLKSLNFMRWMMGSQCINCREHRTSKHHQHRPFWQWHSEPLRLNIDHSFDFFRNKHIWSIAFCPTRPNGLQAGCSRTTI